MVFPCFSYGFLMKDGDITLFFRTQTTVSPVTAAPGQISVQEYRARILAEMAPKESSQGSFTDLGKL